MFRCLTSLITLAAFAAHMAWGCCAHHAHAVELSAHDAAVEAVEHGSGDSHRHCRQETAHAQEHDADGGEPCEDHRRHSPHDCGEPSCAFKTQAKVELPVDRTVTAFVPLSLVTAPAALPQRPEQIEARYPLGAPTSAGARPQLQTWRL